MEADSLLKSGLVHNKKISFISANSIPLNKMDVSIIATLYSYEPVIASVTKLGATNLYLLIHNKPNEKQNKAVEVVKKTIGKYVNISLVRTEVYDIVKVAEDSVKLIDKLYPRQKVILNISAARKTKALGLMFAGYARANKVENIIYLTKENHEMIILPKMSFNLNKSQIMILQYFMKKGNIYLNKKIYNELNISKSMFYKTVNELTKCGFLMDKKVTDAGKIALL